MKRREPVAFTLIEMLVVIGIILVLGSILLPALFKAKEWGKAARCASNLRQLQIATMNYVSDNGGYPAASSYASQDAQGQWWHTRGWISWTNSTGPFPSQPSGPYSWRGAIGVACITTGTLWPYAGHQDIYLCPTFAEKSVCGQTDAVRSYAMNTNVNAASFFRTNSPDTAVHTVLYGDDGGLPAQIDPQFGTNEVATWHSGKGQVVFLDGHVEKW